MLLILAIIALLLTLALFVLAEPARAPQGDTTPRREAHSAAMVPKG
jgi:hypothetical protein